jgi:hypothetical protein
MTIADHDAYFRVCDALGKKPNESLIDAARRAMWRTRGRKRRAARIIAGPVDGWPSILQADRVLRGVAP